MKSQRTPIIKTVELTKEFRTDDFVTSVLHGVNCEIMPGEFVAIMGPSGSGKSTLMHILGFLDTATSGQYFFDGRDVSTLSEDELALMRGEQAGFIFQLFHLLPKMSVLENVKVPLLYSNVPVAERDALAKKAIAEVGLTERIGSLTHQLSGGERQRVAIARALIRKPKVIFADEPTGNLDSKTGAQVMALLEDLHCKHGHTIVLVTHETFTAEHTERIIQLRDGVIVADVPVAHRRTAKDDGLKK